MGGLHAADDGPKRNEEEAEEKEEAVMLLSGREGVWGGSSLLVHALLSFVGCLCAFGEFSVSLYSMITCFAIVAYYGFRWIHLDGCNYLFVLLLVSRMRFGVKCSCFII